MEGLDHLEHLDKHLVDELAQVARETVRDELREQTRKQRRTAMLYAASGAAALYAGGALALTVGLALALGMPGWVAALITAVILGAVAYVLRAAARQHPSGPVPEHGAHEAGAPAGRGWGTGSHAPGGPVTGPAGPGRSAPAPRPDDIDPEPPHHRA